MAGGSYKDSCLVSPASEQLYASFLRRNNHYTNLKPVGFIISPTNCCLTRGSPPSFSPWRFCPCSTMHTLSCVVTINFVTFLDGVVQFLKHIRSKRLLSLPYKRTFKCCGRD